MKRLFDLILAILSLVILLPVFIVISLWVLLDSKGGIFYLQSRVGWRNKDFLMYKFRSMRPGADAEGLLTIGGKDPRVSRAGFYLRKTKLDELPQLLNIIKGEMSFVGPRPEVRKYVELYTEEQLLVLSIRPGLTDYASLEYFEESTLLAKSDEPEKVYIEEIMPAKLALNLRYIKERSLLLDIRIIFMTIARIFS